MTNHFHLVLRLAEAGLSDGMRELNTGFARVSNAQLRTHQPLLRRTVLERPPRDASSICSRASATRCGTPPAPASARSRATATGRASGLPQGSHWASRAARAPRAAAGSSGRARPRLSGPFAGFVLEGTRELAASRGTAVPASSRQRVLGARAALGRRQAAALRRDRAALDAVRRGDLDRRPSVSAAGSDLVDLRRAHARPELGRARAAPASATRMWLGWSSRVRLPDRKTDESLSKVSSPSGAGYDRRRDPSRAALLGVALGRPVAGRQTAPASPSSSPAQRRRRARSPRPKAWRMFRTSRRSRQTNDCAQRVVVGQPSSPSPRPSDRQAASAASRPDSTA